MDLTSTDDGHNTANTEMKKAAIQPGVNMFQKEGLKCRGNLLNTVNGNFTAATRGGLLSSSTFKWEDSLNIYIYMTSQEVFIKHVCIRM